MNAAAAALESLELYKGAEGGAPSAVEKLDVVECLRRTAPEFFAALTRQRNARVADVLGGCDPLAAALDFDDADAAAEVAFSLRGKTVVVTGASRGIGEAIAVRWGGSNRFLSRARLFPFKSFAIEATPTFTVRSSDGSHNVTLCFCMSRRP